METDSAILRLVQSGTLAGASPDLLDPGSGIATPEFDGPIHPSDHHRAVRLLSLDAHGRVLNWISWQEAACLYSRDAVVWTLGDPCIELRGGTDRFSGEQTLLELHPIIASRGHVRSKSWDPTPTLTNTALFARDANICMYCGSTYTRPHLTRDHVQPVSRGGKDLWENVVTACIACNSRKGSRTPQQASMPLLAVPYRPSWVEHLILSNRNILADQMAFLKAQLPKNARMRA